MMGSSVDLERSLSYTQDHKCSRESHKGHHSDFSQIHQIERRDPVGELDEDAKGDLVVEGVEEVKAPEPKSQDQMIERALLLMLPLHQCSVHSRCLK